MFNKNIWWRHLLTTLRYRKEDAENYNYVDVLPPGGDSFEVQDLKVGTKYSFSIMAFNSVGHSEYTKDIGKVETKSKNYFNNRIIMEQELYYIYQGCFVQY